MSSLILPPSYRTSVQAHQRPVPNPEIEAKVKQELATIDSLLDLIWVEGVVLNARHNQYEGRYALVCRWPMGDKRWGMIQSGEIGNTPYDILGWFTEDVQNAESPSFEPSAIDERVMKLLASADNNRVDWKIRLASSAQNNIDRKKKIQQDFLENQGHDIASYERNRALGIHQVSVLGDVK